MKKSSSAKLNKRYQVVLGAGKVSKHLPELAASVPLLKSVPVIYLTLSLVYLILFLFFNSWAVTKESIFLEDVWGIGGLMCWCIWVRLVKHIWQVGYWLVNCLTVGCHDRRVCRAWVFVYILQYILTYFAILCRMYSLVLKLVLCDHVQNFVRFGSGVGEMGYCCWSEYYPIPEKSNSVQVLLTPKNSNSVQVLLGSEKSNSGLLFFENFQLSSIPLYDKYNSYYIICRKLRFVTTFF